jgi:branched-subunit amino acid aminotransferase/4-amino-4-deoxychorismate lyase
VFVDEILGDCSPGGAQPGSVTTEDALETLALTNYGHFTTMRVHEGRVRGLTLHLDRLVRDCWLLFGCALDHEVVRQEIRAALGGPEPMTVRVSVCNPAFSLVSPAKKGRPEVIVTTRPACSEDLPPLRVRSAPYRRDVPAVKHAGLFGPLFERRQAQLADYDDAVFMTDNGLLSEGVTWNLGFLDGDTLVWPAAEALPGVTAALLTTAHQGPVRVEPVSLDRLPRMAAAFATNSGTGVRAIGEIDGFTWSSEHPALATLRAEYATIEAEEV